MSTNHKTKAENLESMLIFTIGLAFLIVVFSIAIVSFNGPSHLITGKVIDKTTRPDPGIAASAHEALVIRYYERYWRGDEIKSKEKYVQVQMKIYNHELAGGPDIGDSVMVKYHDHDPEISEKDIKIIITE